MKAATTPTPTLPAPAPARHMVDLCDIMLDQITINLSSKLVPSPDLIAKLSQRRRPQHPYRSINPPPPPGQE
jgi:hypothetical protein